MERITLPQIEAAINYWRARSPAQESRLCPQAAALAAPYALMIVDHRFEIDATGLTPEAQAAYQVWFDAAG